MISKNEIIELLIETYPSTSKERIIYIVNQFDSCSRDEAVNYITELILNEYSFYDEKDITVYVSEIIKTLERDNGI